jgi:hypothetical protein
MNYSSRTLTLLFVSLLMSLSSCRSTESEERADSDLQQAAGNPMECYLNVTKQNLGSVVGATDGYTFKDQDLRSLQLFI